MLFAKTHWFIFVPTQYIGTKWTWSHWKLLLFLSRLKPSIQYYKEKALCKPFHRECEETLSHNSVFQDFIHLTEKLCNTIYCKPKIDKEERPQIKLTVSKALFNLITSNPGVENLNKQIRHTIFHTALFLWAFPYSHTQTFAFEYGKQSWQGFCSFY